jgi:uncharacterized sulfatase
MTTRKEFIKLLSAGGAALTLPSFFQDLAQKSKGSERPNIIWLNSEDGSPDIGCYSDCSIGYGNSLVHTPNLDQLAQEGARYTNAYAPCPVCSPARSSYITGMYPTSIGAQNHRSHRRDGYHLEAPIKPLTYYFKKAGYFCTNGEFGHPDRHGKTDYNFSYDFDKMYDATDWKEHKPDQPFFAQIHFDETHRPYTHDDYTKPDVNHPVDPDKIQLPPYFAGHQLLREDWALYLESWGVLDRMVGKVLNELEKAGLAENTVVFFCSDGGRSNYRCKDWLYDGGIQIPLLVRWQGHINPGTVDHQFVNGIDLAPTWMHIAGIKPPDYLQGRNFLNPQSIPKREFIFASRDRYDGIVDRIRCVRSRRFKYIRNFYAERPYLYPYVQGDLYKLFRYPAITLMPYLKQQGKLNAVQEQFLTKIRPPEELYDIQKDPHEVHNLADDAKYEGTLLFFRDKLNIWMYKTNDHGRVPEDPKIPAYYRKKMIKRYGPGMKRRGAPLDNFNPEDYINWWKKRNHRLTI